MTRADSPVWMTLVAVFGATVVQQVLPNCEEVTVGEPTEALRGLSKFGWLKALNISVRNWKRKRSVMLNLLTIDVSKFHSPGPLNEPRETLPKVPASGIRKARGSNHWPGFPRIRGPLKPGFRLGTSEKGTSPVPEAFEPTRGVKGKPL